MTESLQRELATEAGPGRSRDAVRTRQLLLQAAGRRFARDGYGATKSRDIAADVGVNVALINRYFASKEGLFEACLARTVEELDEAEDGTTTFEQVIRGLIEQVSRTTKDEKPLPLPLLLRSSGDERADMIRRRAMHAYTERLAATAGWRADDPATASVLLRAQLAMSLGLGVAMLRASGDLQPLAGAQAEELEEPLRSALTALLPTS